MRLGLQSATSSGTLSDTYGPFVTPGVDNTHQGDQESIRLQVIARIRKSNLELIQERKSKRRYPSPRHQHRKEVNSDLDDYTPSKSSPPHKCRKLQ
jgi:hypothetical protein